MVFSVETLKPFRLAFDRLFLGILSTSEQFAGAGNTCGLSKHEHYKLLAPKAEGFFMPSLFTCLIFYHFRKQKSTSPPKTPRCGLVWLPSGPLPGLPRVFPYP